MRSKQGKIVVMQPVKGLQILLAEDQAVQGSGDRDEIWGIQDETR